MAPTLLSRWGKKVLLLLLLCNVGLALVTPHLKSINDPFALPSLAKRQSESEGEGDGCLDYLCTPASCGSGLCGGLRRRGFRDAWSNQALRYRVWNDTSSGYESVSRAELDELIRSGYLTKRVFKKNYKEWTPQNVDDYLPTLLRDKDTQFGDRYFELIEDKLDNTVSGEFTLKQEKAFTVGTGGLHGCTIVTIVSNRAVYMGHYWEVAAMGGKYGDFDPVTFSPTDPRGPNFQKRVLNAITGDGEQDPKTQGSGFNPRLYNRATDQTRVFITSPAVWEWQGAIEDGTGPETWLYKNRINQITNAILGKFVANKPKVIVLPYRRLRWSNGPDGNPVGEDANLVDKSARGLAFFQYDGTYIGSYWRLFYEYTMYVMGDEQRVGEDQPGP